MKLVVDGVAVEVEVHAGGARVCVAGEWHEVACVREPDGALRVGGRRAWTDGARVGVGHSAGTVRRVVAAAAGAATPALTPPIPSTVLRVLAAPGDEVEAGQLLLVLGAMKTELPIRAPHAGRIAEVLVRPGQSVAPGDRLVRLAPAPEIG